MRINGMSWVRSFLVAVLIITVALGTLSVTTRKAVAQEPSITPMHFGWAGYQGNDTIYIATSIGSLIDPASLSSSAYILPPVNNSSTYSWGSKSSGLIGASAGMISSGTGNFVEQFIQDESPVPSLYIQIPVALIGALKVFSNSAKSANLSGGTFLNVSLSEKDSSGIGIHRQPSLDTGLNVTGMNGGAGYAPLLRLILDAAALGLVVVPGSPTVTRFNAIKCI